jgi:hypothetical protein
MRCCHRPGYDAGGRGQRATCAWQRARDGRHSASAWSGRAQRTGGANPASGWRTSRGCSVAAAAAMAAAPFKADMHHPGTSATQAVAPGASTGSRAHAAGAAQRQPRRRLRDLAWPAATAPPLKHLERHSGGCRGLLSGGGGHGSRCLAGPPTGRGRSWCCSSCGSGSPSAAPAARRRTGGASIAVLASAAGCASVYRARQRSTGAALCCPCQHQPAARTGTQPCAARVPAEQLTEHPGRRRPRSWWVACAVATQDARRSPG